MTPQERDVIGGIFDRLRQAEGQPRDPQAEAFIAERLRQQPYAPYVLAQAVYVQEQTMTQMQERLQFLEQEVQRLQSQPQQQSGGFLSSLFGGGRPQTPPPAPQQMQQRPMMGQPPMGQPGYGQQGPMGQPMMGQQPGPWGQQQPQQRGGMGFLGTAAMAAVGVAGGMLAANAISNMMGGGAAQAAGAAGNGLTPVDQAAAEPAGPDMPAGPEMPASYDQASYDDGNSYDSGGDEWA
jgi:hypothetical protein